MDSYEIMIMNILNVSWLCILKIYDEWFVKISKQNMSARKNDH